MSRVRVLAAGMAVGVIAALASALPSSAHDQLIASSPSAGERLDAAPEGVSLEFSGQLLVLDGAGALVMVVDPAGRDWLEGAPVVEGHMVTAALAPGMPEAGYEIRWRVVSSDGHPISGVIPFTIGDAAPLSAASPGSGRTDAQQQDQTAPDIPRALRVALVGAGGAAIAAALFTVISFLRRRARRGGSGDLASNDARRERS